MDHKIEKLLQFLSEKYLKLETIKVDAENQTKNILEGNLDGIEFIINKRDQISKDVDLIDAKFLEQFEAIKKEYDVNELSEIKDLDKEDIKKLQDKITDIKTLLSEIMLIDKKNILSMENLIEDNKKDLKQVKNGRKLNKAYNQNISGSIMINDEL